MYKQLNDNDELTEKSGDPFEPARIDFKFQDAVLNRYYNVIMTQEKMMEGSLKRFESDVPIVKSEQKVYTFHNDPINLACHATITPVIEDHLGKKLFPTHCFVRIYPKGSTLGEHYDKVTSEYAVTYCHSSEIPWTINLHGESMETTQGSCILYKGNETLHGRVDPAPCTVLQSFYFWVEKGGEFDHWKYNKDPLYKKIYQQI